MHPVLSLVGYDRKTDRLITEVTIPDSVADTVIHDLDLNPREEPGDVRLTAAQAERIARTLQTKIDVRQAEFFLEISARSPA